MKLIVACPLFYSEEARKIKHIKELRIGLLEEIA